MEEILVELVDLDELLVWLILHLSILDNPISFNIVLVFHLFLFLLTLSNINIGLIAEKTLL